MPRPANDLQDAGTWRSACAAIGLCLLVLVAAAALLPPPEPRGDRTRVVLCLLAVEAVAIALAGPFLAAGGARARFRFILVPLVAIAPIGFVLCAVAARGSVPLGRLAWAHLFLAAFGCLLAALTMALRSLRLRAAASQAVASIVGLAMLTQVFFANTLVEGAPGQGARMLVVGAVLWTNPWLIAGGSLLDADPIRAPLYDTSVISYYGFQYPCSGIGAVWLRALILTAVYGACAAALLALARIRRRPESVH
jgi:hypothetical protein